ncbi:LLM class flavin-dependent oxidoreductase [Nocardia bhagyanarayanae]|uniref:Alkanesulfonate monooxygenase SsuD/methylene tetrahydromethanopterin reductase-like flavin-dependent oxidoreductase (Luciferase family) n=1 Tax=Nocardia bhagyanarayanae TaxID=1215925 RepID=A0A543FFQ3_9NOCA|nr:LLM class flavin-dependent oxidoreductase [Nocardia bhagyanarayanae]TQM32584.1 alkanesulfonate monooxygenase SsuD/methylene tetrahydromethanopterin reductase-like flavin-dependent oxidoreductase (luciferase family) [Nocardia bhagyanarayanae]
MELDLLYALTNRSGEQSWHDVMLETRRHTQLADRLGFDRIWLGEHHFDVDGTDASPNPIMLATDLAARTERLRFGMAAVSLTLWHPLRVAEDLALLDHFSGGRLDVAFGRGILPIEVMNLNPAANRWNGSDTSREIFDENLAIVRKIWTEDLFSWKGKRYTFPEPGTKFIHSPGAPMPEGWVGEDGNLVAFGMTPRPLQQPTPPLFAVTESMEGFLGAARKNLRPITWYPTGKVLTKLFENYRDEVAATTGTMPALGEGCGVLRLCCIAETDAEARRVAEPAIVEFFEFLCRVRGIGVWLDADEDPADPRYREMDPWDLLMERDHLMIGSPESVTERMTRLTETHGIQHWLLQMGAPGIAAADVDRSLELFAAEVMPHLRKLDASLRVAG